MTYNLKFIFLFSILFLTILNASCDNNWTDKKRKDFAYNCSLIDTIPNLDCSVTGFKYSEINPILVQRINNGLIIDTFNIFASKSGFDSLRSRYYVYIPRVLLLKDTYRFILKCGQSFKLSEMKMVMWPQYSMFSEGYGCVMGDYKIDDVRFENQTNPDFIKPGFKMFKSKG
jgi:hypothetical protein